MDWIPCHHHVLDIARYLNYRWFTEDKMFWAIAYDHYRLILTRIRMETIIGITNLLELRIGCIFYTWVKVAPTSSSLL